MRKTIALSLIILLVFIVLATVAVFARSIKARFSPPPPTPKITVTIPEGATVGDINKLLMDAGVLVGEELPRELEGYLFPDTYEFFLGSKESVVQERLQENFNRKVSEVLPGGLDENKLHDILTIASLVEKEVSNSEDRRLVSGIIWKRLEKGMLLQIDSSLCYTKETPCLPITKEDKESDSLYNTYRYPGLPPGPIGNPGLDAIRAAFNPEQSEYWYYISDQETGKTVFAKTLDEHNRNIVKYLGN